MARVVAIGNLKGGVGKSTLAVNLACEMASPSRRVAQVDADEQGTASSWAARGTFAPGSTADNEIKAVAAIVRRLLK